MRRASGFTLLEMAIVLAIIGAVVGGIMLGTSMIQTSRIRQIGVNAQSYTIAIQQFRDQYGEFPGDFSTAIMVWGDDNAVCPNGSITDGVPGTCNGDGDGNIENSEAFRGWQQLSLSGFLQGNFNGQNGAGGSTHAVPGSNSPIGPIKNTTYGLNSLGVRSGDATYFDGNYNNWMLYGLADSAGAPQNSVLTPQEAYDIDTKSDDGRPAFGLVTSRKGTLAATGDGSSCVGNNGGDTAGTTATTAEYRRHVKQKLCVPYFMYGYGVQNKMKEQ